MRYQAAPRPEFSFFSSGWRSWFPAQILTAFRQTIFHPTGNRKQPKMEIGAGRVKGPQWNFLGQPSQPESVIGSLQPYSTGPVRFRRRGFFAPTHDARPRLRHATRNKRGMELRSRSILKALSKDWPHDVERSFS
jgi:hypothetical protein